MYWTGAGDRYQDVQRFSWNPYNSSDTRFETYGFDFVLGFPPSICVLLHVHSDTVKDFHESYCDSFTTYFLLQKKWNYYEINIYLCKILFMSIQETPKI